MSCAPDRAARALVVDRGRGRMEDEGPAPAEWAGRSAARRFLPMPNKAHKREVLRLAKRLLTEDLSFKGYSILPNSCWMQGPPEVVARAEAAGSLAKFGADVAPAIPALIRLLADDNVCYGEDDCHYTWWHTVSDSAVAALVQIGRPAVPALIEALASAGDNVRLKAT